MSLNRRYEKMNEVVFGVVIIVMALSIISLAGIAYKASDDV